MNAPDNQPIPEPSDELTGATEELQSQYDAARHSEVITDDEWLMREAQDIASVYRRRTDVTFVQAMINGVRRAAPKPDVTPAEAVRPGLAPNPIGWRIG